MLPGSRTSGRERGSGPTTRSPGTSTATGTATVGPSRCSAGAGIGSGFGVIRAQCRASGHRDLRGAGCKSGADASPVRRRQEAGRQEGDERGDGAVRAGTAQSSGVRSFTQTCGRWHLGMQPPVLRMAPTGPRLPHTWGTGGLVRWPSPEPDALRSRSEHLPIVTATRRKPKTSAFKTGVVQAVHAALTASDANPNDRFHRIIERSENDFRLDPTFPDVSVAMGRAGIKVR